jgi:hypothetical protein
VKEALVLAMICIDLQKDNSKEKVMCLIKMPKKGYLISIWANQIT